MSSNRWIIVAACLAMAGCSTPPPPPLVPVPTSPENGAVKSYEPLRPLAEPPPAVSPTTQPR